MEKQENENKAILSDENKKVVKTTINFQKMQSILSIWVNLHPEKIISGVISQLRAKNMTYEEIGKVFGTAKATVHRLERMTYFPKKPKNQQNLFKIAFDLL